MPCICPPSESGYEYSQWIGSLFGACAYTPVEKSAYIFGAISLALWFVALLPQIITNYYRKSGEGVSLGFVGLSILGGLGLFLGGILTNSPLPISLLGLYVILCNLVVAGQVLYYARRLKSSRLSAVRFSAVIFSIMAPMTFMSWASVDRSAMSRTLLEAVIDTNRCDYRPEISPFMQTIGSVLAWTAGVIFFCSRAPQIWKNYVNKEVRLSLGMMGLIVLGNITLGLQVLLLTESNTFWSKTFPVLLASVGLVIWDLIILLQAFLYRKRGRYF